MAPAPPSPASSSWQHIEELLPIMVQPVTAEYCESYSLMFRRWLPRGGGGHSE